MPKANAFSGLKLSDQAVPAGSGVDQRLFSQNVPEPTPPPSPQAEPAQEPATQTETQETGKLARREAGKKASQPGGRESGQPFDINARPYRKDSFLFTEDEHDALEDLKLELRRTFDIRATKNEIVRCAVHHVIEDFRRDGEGSIILRRLRKARPR